MITTDFSVYDQIIREVLKDCSPFDPYAIRRDFPILSKKVEGKDLIWFDNGATTQKPRQVIERIKYFYENENSNVHRGAHTLASKATDAYEGAREKVREFINAALPEEIIFTRGATEAINLAAQTYGRANLGEGDEILISEMEHHANIVPWQMIAREKGAQIVVLPIDDAGNLLISALEERLSHRTKIVAIAQVSNVLGSIAPVREVISLAHEAGAKVLVDGAQSVPHMPVDVKDLGCDFFVLSGHKMYAPTGIGILYISGQIAENMPPYHGGGNMIQDVTFEKTIYRAPPHRFEAGTGSIADAVGLGAAIDYVSSLGLSRIRAYEDSLLTYALEKLEEIPKVNVIGAPDERAGVISFTVEGLPDEDVGRALCCEGIAVRAGHHCAQPVLRRFGKESSVRISFSFYNIKEEIEFLAHSICGIIRKSV